MYADAARCGHAAAVSVTWQICGGAGRTRRMQTHLDCPACGKPAGFASGQAEGSDGSCPVGGTEMSGARQVISEWIEDRNGVIWETPVRTPFFGSGCGLM